MRTGEKCLRCTLHGGGGCTMQGNYMFRMIYAPRGGGGGNGDANLFYVKVTCSFVV
jgi:hypothetical protein